MFGIKSNINFYRLCFILVFLLSAIRIQAQDNGIKASAPSVVQTGRAFNYSLSGDVQGRVRLPEMKGIRVVAGPSQSIRSGSTNINGRLKTIMEVTYSYMLMIEEEGEYEIPPATIISGTKEFHSNPVKIKVVKGTSQTQATERGEEDDESVMIRQLPSDRDIYLGEQIVVETKVYVRENLRITGLEEPGYSGFWREEIESDEFVQNESVGGRTYRTQVIKRDLLTAQKSGEIQVEPVKMDVVIRKVVSSRRRGSIFDEFFNDPFFNDPMQRYESVPASFSSNALTINVKPLPAGAPASFNGAVGEFSMSASINRDSAGMNESILLKVNIRGEGNLSLLQAPEIDFPPDLEVFDPKSSSEIKHGIGGSTGRITYEYLIIPRSRGNFRIAPIEFSYFDPSTQNYKTEKSKEFNFVVSGGEEEAGNISTGQLPEGFFREDVRNIESDIRYIKTGNITLKKRGENLVSSAWMMVYPVGLLLFIILLIIRKKNMERRADVKYIRNRRASKLAGRRLKNARALMVADNDDFYEEVLKAFWGYLADKLGISTSELTRDTVQAKLDAHELPSDIHKELWDLLDECEYARYAPGVSADKKELYQRAENCLSAIEQKI